MQYTWFKIFNKAEFDALGLVSKTYTYVLDQFGQKDFLVTKGNAYGVTLDGVMLALGIGTDSPFTFEDMALYLDSNDDVWWGFAVET